ncbi:hypothetical protein AB0E01_44655 [Nocardia vinacea]
MVRQFEQFFAPNAGQTQNLDGGERPERLLFLIRQVAAFSCHNVFGPDKSADRLGGNGFAQCAVGAVDDSTWLREFRSGQQAGGGQTTIMGGSNERRQHGQPFAGALVHASLAVLEVLALLHFGVGDRAGRDPRTPAGRILNGPMRDIKVERTDPKQLVFVVQARCRHLDSLAGRTGCVAFDGGDRLLPGAHHLRRKPQRVASWSQRLDACPEQSGQCSRRRVEAGEVQRGLPFTKVVDQQVSDGSALDAIAVDTLLDCESPAGQSERADAVRRAPREYAQGAKLQIEVDFLLSAAGLDPAYGLHELHAVSDHDVGDAAALAGQDRGYAGRRDLRIRRRAGRFGGGQIGEPSEPAFVPDLGHHRCQIAVGTGEHPWQAGSQHVAADQHQEPGLHVDRVARPGSAAGLCHPGRRQLHPFRSRAFFGAAGQPAVLPGFTRERRQPAQQLGDPTPSPSPGSVDRGCERRGGQPPLHLLGRCRGMRPPVLAWSCGKLVAQLTIPQSLLAGDRGDGGQGLACSVLDEGGHNVLPNSTLSTCGS